MVYTEIADHVLLAAVGSDPDAFGTFYRRHENRVLRYFLRRGAELAADLTAEVFAAALVAAARFEPAVRRRRGSTAFPAARSPRAGGVARSRRASWRNATTKTLPRSCVARRRS
jgi:hypothetical protein